MRKNAVFTHWAAALSTLVGLSSQAFAQAAAEPSPAPASSAAATPTATAAPATAASATTTTEPTPATPAAAAAAPADTAAAPAAPPAEAPPPSYFRIDHDYAFGLQLWAGATYPIVQDIGLATDIYIAENAPGVSVSGTSAKLAQSWWGEFDIGPAFTFGPLSLTPMVGLAFDWAAKHPVAINGPQLYTILTTDKIYFESWIWTLLYSTFSDQATSDYFHTRDWVLYKINGTVAVGPQWELWTNLQGKFGNKGLFSMPLGAHVDLAYGTGNTLGLFVGYETNKDARDAAGGKYTVGRLTFVHNF